MCIAFPCQLFLAAFHARQLWLFTIPLVVHKTKNRYSTEECQFDLSPLIRTVGDKHQCVHTPVVHVMGTPIRAVSS
jgi:hypothetical protein